MANGEKQVEHDAEALANALECDHPDITELLSAVKASARAAQQSQHVTQRTLLRVAQNRLADENVGTAVAWLALASPTAASADSTAEQLCVLAGKSAVQLHKPALHATRREQAIGQLFMHGTSMQLLPLDTQRQLAQRLVHLISQVSDDYDRAAAFLAVCNILLARANKLHDDTRSVVSCEITKLGLEHLRLHAFPFWAIPNAASALLRLTASAADDTTALSELLLRMALSDVEQTRAIACTSLQCASNPLHTAKPLVHALDSLDCTSAARFRHQHAFRLAAAVASAVSACSADGCVEELDARGDTYVLLQHAGLPANALPKRNLSDLDKLIQDARAAVHELPNAQSKPLERVHIGILAATSVFRTFSSSTSITASIGDVAALAGRTASHSLKFLTSDAADDVKYELQCVFAVRFANNTRYLMDARQYDSLVKIRLWSTCCRNVLAGRHGTFIALRY